MMQEIISRYKSYLEIDCRYNRETVASHLGTLSTIFNNMKIASVNEIDAQKVTREWIYQRWEPTSEGIKLSASSQGGYLLALKEFLKYLEDAGFQIQDGVSDIIRVPEPQPDKLSGLTPEEQKKLREFLLFNVTNDSRRKQTALVFLLWSLGCRLNEILALNIHDDGVINRDDGRQSSGDFDIEGDEVYVTVRGIGDPHRRVLIPKETLAFVNFYLENRKERSSILFLNNSRKGAPRRLSEATAIKMIEEAFEKAGIRVRQGRATDVLRNSSPEKALKKAASGKPRTAPSVNRSSTLVKAPHLFKPNALSWQFPPQNEVA